MVVTGILGKKIGMTQVFDEKGEVYLIIVLQVGPCVVIQLKTLVKDGYEVVQIGLVEFVKSLKVNKLMAGHFGKSNVPLVKLMREVVVEAVVAVAKIEEMDGESTSNGNGLKAGDRVLVDIFSSDKYVDVIGISKGRGFAGVVRRHKFGGGFKAHGHMFQVQGLIGASSFSLCVFFGQRMLGHYGVDQVTVRNLRIRGIDLEENLLMVEGVVLGSRDGYVLISKAKVLPCECRGFAGAITVDLLKASKKALAGKKKQLSRLKDFRRRREDDGKH